MVEGRHSSEEIGTETDMGLVLELLEWQREELDKEVEAVAVEKV